MLCVDPEENLQIQATDISSSLSSQRLMVFEPDTPGISEAFSGVGNPQLQGSDTNPCNSFIISLSFA